MEKESGLSLELRLTYIVIFSEPPIVVMIWVTTWPLVMRLLDIDFLLFYFQRDARVLLFLGQACAHCQVVDHLGDSVEWFLFPRMSSSIKKLPAEMMWGK